MKNKKIKLNGTWKAWPGKKAPLSENYYTSKESANYWYDVKLPHNWNLDKRFNNDEFIVYYYNSFNLEGEIEDKKYILNLENVFNQFSLYVNGDFVVEGSTYFTISKINISKYLKAGENFLYLKVSWPISEKSDPFTGIYSNFEYGNSAQIYGGICGEVELDVFDSCYIKAFNIDYTLYENRFADMNVKFNTVSEFSFDGILDWTLTPYNFEGKEFKGSEITSVKKGSSYTQFNFRVGRIRLWWPWEQGFPHLYKLKVTVLGEDLDVVCHEDIIGFRNVNNNNRKIEINNHRLFLRGVHYLPTSYYMSEITREKLEEDIQLILDAGFNCVRLFHHVANKDFYEICNENGLLVWQDIPFNFSTSKMDDREILKKSVQLQKELHKNPSIIIFATPSIFDSQFYNLKDKFTRKLLLNKMYKTLKKIEKSKLVLRSHSYFSLVRILDWRFQVSNRFQEFKSALNRIGKTDTSTNIITSYGFPAYPEIATMIKMSRNLDEDSISTWTGTLDVDKRNIKSIDSQIPRRNYERASSYYMATQHFQARLVRFYGELWRRYKFRSYNGCFLYFFNDPELVVSESLVDYYNRPKQAYYAAKSTMQPISVLMDWPSEHYTDGDLIRLDIYVINDTKNEFPSAILKWEAINSTGDVLLSKRKVVDLMKDEVSIGAVLEWDIDDSVELDEYEINIKLILPTKEMVTNSYRINIK
ncbi:MAG: sugar-binding domain-containing protein [Clostridia bacterium]